MGRVHRESLKPRKLCWAGKNPHINSTIKTKQNKNQNGTLHREHIFVRGREQNPKNLTW